MSEDNRISNFPFCTGHIKLLYDKTGVAHDFMFIDANDAFESHMGIIKEDVLLKPLSKVFPKKRDEIMLWAEYFSNVLASGKTQDMNQWMNSLGRHLHIIVTPSSHSTIAFVLYEKDDSCPEILNDYSSILTPLGLDNLFHFSHDAIALVDYNNGHPFYICNNAVHQKMTGFSAIKDVPYQDVVGKNAFLKNLKCFTKCVKTGNPETISQNYTFAPGGRKWETTITPLRQDDDGFYLLCSSKDISDYARVQRENEDLTRRMFSMFYQHSVVKMTFDPEEFKIVDANPAACEFYGYTEDEMHNLSLQKINTLPDPEFRANVKKAIAGPRHFEAIPHKLKDGRTRIVDVYASPIIVNQKQYIYLIVFDVTSREKYKNDLFLEKEVFRTTLNSIGDGVVTTDTSGIITGLNPMANNLTGWGDDAIGRHFSEVFVLKNEHTGLQVENPVDKVLKTGSIIGLANHTVLINRSGRKIHIADSAAPIVSEDGQAYGVVMVFRNVDKEKEHIRQITHLSYHDSLTEIFNRRYVENNIDYLGGEEYLPLSIIMGDVNGLKMINDVFGHETGDLALKKISELLVLKSRKEDLVARWGGDEFVMLMPRTNLQEAEVVAERIQNESIVLNDTGLNLSISLGCATKYSVDINPHRIIREAEENMYRQKLLEDKSYRNIIINTLLSTLYERSMETEEHSKRLDCYCQIVGEALGLSSRELRELSLLSLLHDIGKVGIDSNILKKPTSLTSEEWNEIKKHPEIGYRIVQNTPELSSVANLVLTHHEHWDGNGYPKGLKGEEIPLASRILAVVDAFDAMTNDRTYRRAKSYPDAIAELKNNAGSQFDPQIVSAFVKLL